MAEREGLWPGVVAIVGDADLYCVACAEMRYGLAAVQAVIYGVLGYEHASDHEGNPLGVVLSGSQGIDGQACGRCCALLDEDV